MKFLMFGNYDVAKTAQVSAAPVENGRLPRGLTGGLVVSFLGLLTYFGVLLYATQVLINEHGYPQTAHAWAGYIGVCLFLLGALVFVVVAPFRAGTGRLIMGPAVSFLGLLTYFGAYLYSMQRWYMEYGYPETGDEWAAHVGVCLFLLGALVFVVVAPFRAGTRQLIMGPAVSFLGLLTYFGALLYAAQVLINEHGYPQTAHAWAGYIGICVFLLGALVFVVNVLSARRIWRRNLI